MVKITFNRHNGDIKAIYASGHAGFKKNKNGHDLVCCAVSTLLINTVNSIESLTDDLISSEESDGLLIVVLKDNTKDGTKLLIDSLELGLKNIAEEYGDKYLTVDYKEV